MKDYVLNVRDAYSHPVQEATQAWESCKKMDHARRNPASGPVIDLLGNNPEAVFFLTCMQHNIGK